MTGLPFVYAAWTGRAGAIAADGVRTLQEAQAEGVRVVSRRSPRSTAGATPAQRGGPLAYLRDNMKYGLGADEAAGLQLFLDYAADLGLAPRKRRHWNSSKPCLSLRRDARERPCEEGVGRRPRRSRRGARALSRRADAPARPPGRRDPRPQAPRAHRHLHHRSQRQLHERLRRALQLLRVLPARRIAGGLRARLRRDLPEDRRDDRRRRQPAAAAGRPQSRPADRVVRGSVPRRQGAVSDVQAARAVAARGAAHLEAESASGAGGDRAARSRRVSTAFPAAARRFSSIVCGSS